MQRHVLVSSLVGLTEYSGLGSASISGERVPEALAAPTIAAGTLLPRDANIFAGESTMHSAGAGRGSCSGHTPSHRYWPRVCVRRAHVARTVERTDGLE